MGTHNYPQRRRKPRPHTVRQHLREGRPVNSFRRGRGAVQRGPSRVVGKGDPNEDSTKMGLHSYTVNFSYGEGPKNGESVIVFSDNYESALDEAWEERKDTRTPISVEAIDPDVGAALKWMIDKSKSGAKYGVSKITKATKLGARYAVRGAKSGVRAGVGVGRESYKLAAFGVKAKMVEALLRLCYQKDKSKRIAARVALKSRYPEVYNMCDFSMPSRPQRRAPPQLTTFPRRYVN